MSNPSKLFTKFRPRRKYDEGGFLVDDNGKIIDTSKGTTAPSTAQPLQLTDAVKKATTPNTPEAKPNYGAIAGTAAALGTGIIDITNPPNEFGHQSVGSSVGKGALTGLAAGATFGPIGAAAGAVIGGAVGLISGEKNKHSDNAMRDAMQTRQAAMERSASQAMIANDPGKVTGYQDPNMFADGGVIGDPKKNIIHNSAVGESVDANLQQALGRRQTNMLDNTNYVLSHAGTRDKRDATVLDPTQASLVTQASMWAQRDDMKGKAPGEIINSFFTQPIRTGNPTDSLRASLNTINHGAAADFNQTPNMNVNPNNAVATLAKGGWISGAVNPAHKGYCSPMTKKTCTPRRKAFAMTMKKHHGFHANGGELYAYGGTLNPVTEVKNPLTEMIIQDGSARKLSSNNTLIVGPSHEDGGVSIPALGSEVEGGETTMDNFIFSKRLGFAQQHKPLAIAKGKIQLKPQTKERITSLKKLGDRETELAMQQETLKKILGI